MSVEVLPAGITCNLRCTYCYQTSLRDANPAERYDREAVLKSIDKLTDPWSLFGGEPLVLNIKHIEELLEIGFKKWGYTGIQTNGSLITDAHIELFRKFKTYVGISVDGPPELNDSRWAGTRAATDKTSARTHEAIRKLCEAAKDTPSLLPNLIVTLHAGNARKEVFPRFVEWIKELDALGVKYINTHVMELDGFAKNLYLPQEELADRLIDLWNLEAELEHVRFPKFAEVLKLLQGLPEHSLPEGRDDVMCHWHECDPLNTQAVQSVDFDGAPSVCKRTFKGEHRWLPAEGTGYAAANVGQQTATRHHTRQLALYVTPQEQGGCAGCEFWLMCKGQCPGEGMDGDWRMRSHYCYTWKRLFAEGGRRLKLMGMKPLNEWKDRKHLEDLMYLMWTNNQPAYLHELVKEYKDCTNKGMVPVKGGYHGDSFGK